MGKYRGYESYKDSGVEWLGEIPEHWEQQRFKFLISEPFKYGANEAAEIDDPTFPRYIRITDVREDGTLREDTFRSLPENIAQDYLLEEGDILLARSGATVGKTFIYRESWGKAAYAGYLIRARVSKNNYSDFVYKFLQSSSYWDWVNSIFIQATIQNISAEKYANLCISIPPLEEQKAIARFLDYKTQQIDALIAKKEALLEKLDEKRTALISHAVTKGLDATVPMKDSGIEWLGEIPEHWEAMVIKRFAEIYDCKHKTVNFVDDGLPVASIAQVQSFYLDLSAAKKTTKKEFIDMNTGGRKPKQGDIILSRNATVGASAIVKDDTSFCMGQDVCLIRPIKTSSVFLNYTFRSIFTKSQINTVLLGSTFKRINVEEVKGLSMCLPPHDEQKEIAEYLDRKTAEIDDQKAKIQQAINLLKEYRTALITNAVTGKIDVRQVEVP